ncbi:MAG TPA: Hpt domain-containing protein [Usitatibacteraceae bacterium]|nr:Hpt domain-containing protein [Usitatibacteraceae bacterium]
MSATPQAFDIGPLSWVKAEIEHSLNEARIQLDKFALEPADAKPAKYASTHLHQVTGALSMVGLGAATLFNEELERLIATLESDPNSRSNMAERIAAAKEAMTDLLGYLDRLMSGEPDRPMLMAGTYLRVNRARGANDAAESDLFSPDLSVVLPAAEDTIALPRAEMMTEAIKQRRLMYQAGLLKLLRDKDFVAGAREMRNATFSIEALQATSPSRAFWFAASGFFDAIAENPAGAGSLAVQLLGRIDQQIKLLIDGIQKVPEKLFRDLLLVIGRSPAQTERLRKIRELYNLEQLLATTPGDVAEHDAQTRAAIRTLREQVQAQKDNWLRFTSGNRAAIDPYVQQAETLYRTSQQQPMREITALLQVLGGIGVQLKRSTAPVGEALALEVATAFLFLESSLENYFRLSTDFADQCNRLVERLKATLSGTQLPDSGPNAMVDSMTQRAQERMLTYQVGQEVHVNLTTIESALDGYFRDPAKVKDLNALPLLFTQVHGALAMLELDEAAALNQMLRERVTQFASGAVKGAGEDAEAVAEGVSALGLYVAAVQQGSVNARDVLLPALYRFGLAERPAPAAPATQRAPVGKAEVEVAKQKVQAAYDGWKEQPEAPESRETLRDAVLELRQEASLAADGKAAEQSDAALKSLDEHADPNRTGVVQAFSHLAPERPAEAPAPQVVQLIDAQSAEIDQELLDIFLEEAGEVVGTIRNSLSLATAQPHDKESMTAIRRGYHTLKGSGRMVGLNDLGEVAWNCEQVMNKWLKEDKPLTPGLGQFIDHTAQAFAQWIASLQATGHARVDGTVIARAAERLKDGLGPDLDAVPVAPAPPQEAPEPMELAAAQEMPVPEMALEEPAIAAGPAEGTPAVTPAEEASRIFGELPGLVPIEPAPGVPPATPADALEDILEQEPPAADVRVGSVVVPAFLFGIYLGEAESHIETLDNEMARLESGAASVASHDFMRAAHTLTSSSRTTGFDTIADVAYPLEKWLQDAIEFRPQFDAHQSEVTRRAVDALASMVRGLEIHEPPEPQTELIAELVALREALHAAHRDVVEVAPPSPPIEAAPAAPLEAEFPAVSAREETEAAQSPAAGTEPEPAASPAPFDAAAVFGVASAGALTAAAGAFAGAAPEAKPEPAPAETAAAPDEPAKAKDRRTIVDDIDHDLLPIFLEEAKDLMPAAGDALRRWRSSPSNHAPVAELARHLHTLKGSARMAGLMRLGELAHTIEERIIKLDQSVEPTAAEFEEIDERLDRYNASIERLAAGDFTAPPIDIPVLADVPKDLPAPLAVLAAARAEIVAEGEKLEGRERQSMLRVNADTIDRFVNEAGELAIARSRIEQEMLNFKAALVELTDNVSRMRTQLREIEIQAEGQIQSRIKEAEESGQSFDPLEFDRFSRTQELTRFLAESLHDVLTLQQSLQKNIDETEAALLHQGRLNRDLQQGLMGVRLVPLGNLQDRFYRLLRQVAKELDKKVNLEFRGTRVEIDRSVLEKITAPLEHLLRNAVSHGIETPQQRLAAGKPETGEISIDARQVGNEVVLTLADDGAGLNFAAIRDKAIAQGLLAADAEATEAQLTQFIFMSGFTTAEQVSQVSGRGVGMDVVRNEIFSLGGRIDIASTAGRGIRFTIALPLTLAVTQAVLVTVGDQVYAIPSVMIEQVQEYKGKRYDAFLETREIDWKGNRYPLRSLEALLGGRPGVSAQRKAAVVLAKSGPNRAAVQVDSIVGNREIVVKNIGPQLARLPGIAGATMTGAGQIILILNPVQLVFRGSAAAPTGDAAPGTLAMPVPDSAIDIAAAEPASAPVVERQSLAEAFAESRPDEPAPATVPRRHAPLVMVVDDSLTVRKITSRMLTREGFEVATAKDGIDGLQQLQDIEPDVILLDIEMPRMDGFEFARNVRADARTKGIPIVMITSRTADKHRNRALEIGVNEYMGKPYQEEQLLALIRQFTAARAAS